MAKPNVPTGRVRERARVHPPVGTESMTKQDPNQDTDLNAMLRKYRATNQDINIPERVHSFGDVSGVNSFFEARLAVQQAQETFDSLPSRIRSYFDNDPAKLVDLLGSADPKAREIAVELGLVESPSAPPPEPAAGS